MKITVKTIDGKCEDFDVSEEATVQELKAQIVSKMDIPLEKQRLIFQGKVIKDDKLLKADCGVDDGKVLHLVLNAPQLASGSTPAPTAEPGPATLSGDPVVLNFVHMQSGLPPDLAAITQDIVDSVVSNFNSEPSGAGGSSRPVTVSAVAHTVDAHGNTLDMSSATASSGVTPNRALPSTTSTSTAAAASQPHETTPTPPAPPPSSSSSSSSSSREAEQLRRRQQEEERVDMERDRAARQLKNVQTHVKTTRRCLHFASKVLERYERAEAAILSADLAAGEPMEVSSEATPPLEPLQFEHPPMAELRPVRDVAYVALLRHMDILQERGRPVIQRHLDFATREQSLTPIESLSASRVSVTVREFSYYMGHASVAFSRLSLNMAAARPRSVTVVPPRRTEMRHIMHQFHTMHPPQPPSSYLIDISRDRNDPETGETVTESTSARVERGDGRPLGVGRGGVGGGGGGGALGPIRIEAGFSMRRSEEDRARDTATGSGVTPGGGRGEGEGLSHTVTVDPTSQPRPSPPAGTTGGGEGSEGETPQYLARLVSELITGVPISQQQAAAAGSSSSSTGAGGESGTAGGSRSGEEKEGASGGGGGAGEGKDGAKPSGEKKEGEGGEEEEEQPRTFAERYAGPEGTTVTIQAAPQPAFGIPGFSPVEGPSISITNPGGGRRPEMNVNFPVPPALQLLQNLLQRATDREAREGGAGGRGAGQEEEEEEEEQQQPAQPRTSVPTASNPFPEDDMDSISDAGSMDSIGSDHEGPAELLNPLTRLANVAASEMSTGARQSMHATLNQMRADIGAPEEDEGSLGMVGLLLQAISKDLSVIELMGIFQGHVAALQQLQPGLINFIRDRCLDGASPTADEQSGRAAVQKFLSGCIPAVTRVSDRLRLKEPDIDFTQTLYQCMHSIFLKGYFIIIKDYSGCGELAFARAVHAWGVESSALFANLLHYCIASDEDFVGAVKLLLSTLFPPNTPAALMDMCNSSVLKHMQTTISSSSPPEEMAKHVVWRSKPSPVAAAAAATAAVPSQETVDDDGTSSTQLPADLGEKDGEPEVKSKLTTAAAAAAADVKEEGGGATPNGGPSAAGSTSKLEGEREREKFDGEFMEAMLEKRSVEQREGWQAVWGADRKVMDEAEPQRPFSDAYASGMPTKKRKVKQLDVSECQPVTAPQLLGRTMARCLETTGAKPIGKTKEEMVAFMEGHAKLGTSLAEEMHYQMAERLTEDPDFDPAHFPNAHTFYEPKKQQ